MAFLRAAMSLAGLPGRLGARHFSRTLSYSEEVFRAKMDGQPLVALESTIITHGMPYPQNLETALAVENIIREKGAVPATVAILKGQLTVGLSREQIEYLAKARGVVKASRRDLAPVAAAGLDGATTVAGTIVAAELAQIPIFVTGGIGGVHREGETTLDVSADLTELGRSPTLVVCSGVKSILDIGRTLEYLETQGVCVCAFGASDEFPAFYTARSGHRAPHRAPDAPHAARILAEARALALSSGTLVAVPVPQEHAMDESVIEEAISTALQEAKTKGISGKEVTPFILAAVAQATAGASLATNIALIKNNAKVGADIAVEFNKLKNVDNLANSFNIGFSRGAEFPPGSRGFHTCARLAAAAAAAADQPVLIIGGANVDRTYRVTEQHIKLDGSTHSCSGAQCAGGVARNMAEALWRLRGGRARLLTAVGADADGRFLDQLAPGLMLDGCIIQGARTPTYAAVIDSSGECRLGLGDMELHNHISIDLVNRHIDVLEKAPLVVLDGNPPQSTIDYVIRHCNRLNKPEPTNVSETPSLAFVGLVCTQHNTKLALSERQVVGISVARSPVFTGDLLISGYVYCSTVFARESTGFFFYEPTDRRKASKPLREGVRIAYASPNLLELRAMAKSIKPHSLPNCTNDFKEILDLAKLLSHLVECLIVTVGARGVIIVRNTPENDGTVNAKLYPVDVIECIENVSGAGDCFASGFLYGVLLGLNEPSCVSVGFTTAKSALLSTKTVPSNFVIQSVINESYYETL